MSIFNKKPDKQRMFNRVSASTGMTLEESRETEMALLKPEPLPVYTGELPKHLNELAARTVLIVFRDNVQMELVGKLMSIRHSCNGSAYITDISMLEHLAREVEKGNMIVRNNKIVLVEKVEKAHRRRI